MFNDSKVVKLLGHLSYENVLSIANQSSAFFCFYDNTKAFESHFTNKIVEYMFYSKPFLHNLKSNFSLNGRHFKVGCSLDDISLMDFIEKSIMNEQKHESLCNIPIEFEEEYSRCKYLEIFD